MKNQEKFLQSELSRIRLTTFSNHQSDQFQSDAEIGGFQEEMWECVEDHHLEKEGKQQTGKRGASMCCKREGKGDGRWYIPGRVSEISLLQ